MLIVKPYGRSAITSPASGEPCRVLCKRDDGIDRDFKEFCREHPALVLAQWISIVDKIARKPSGRSKPSKAQRKFRQKIGAVLWPYLTSKEILSPELEQKFWAKVHPYPKGVSGEDEPRKTRPIADKSHPKKTGGEGKPEGRWYKRFLGDAKPADADLSGLPDKIFEHLYETEYRIAPTHLNLPNKSKGLIAARAESISGNLLKRSAPSGCGWTEADEEAYARGGNVAEEIKKNIKELEKSRRASMRDVAPVLFEQYGRLFYGENDTALSVAEAGQKHPGLFALHQAVKEVYKRRLSGHKPVRNESVAEVLPDSMCELFRLVHSARQNARISHLIRIGKIAHYEAAPKHIVDDWPADRLAASLYWTSDGQAEIKRTDAFVRVWRTVLAHAALTLTDWADPEGRVRADILERGKKKAREILDSAAFDRKASVLFGNRAQDMKSLSLEKKKECWSTICKAVAKLRHSSFHFKGMDGFTKSINVAAKLYFESDVRIDLYKQDRDDRSEYLVKTLQGVQADRHLDKEQFKQLILEISAGSPRMLPLPRFRRVLVRCDTSWSKKPFVVDLPAPANRQKMEESSALRCQYACLKLLYERAFPAWLKDSDTGKLRRWIDRAVERATSDAQKINNDELAVARAAHIAHLDDGDTIAIFLYRLAAETATEIRVQKGYNPDPEAARRKSAYLDNLNCDVMLQAFGDFLNEKKFNWLLKLQDGQENIPRYDLPELPTAETDDIRQWQHVLYVVLHLVPVGEVSRLLHQIQKWNILTLKSAHGGRSRQPDAARSDEAFAPLTDADRLFEVLTLYLDMHDAKFEGGESLMRGDELPRLFESEPDCKKIFPEQDGALDDAHLPLRGLREMQRFGALKYLEPIFEAHRITSKEVSGYLELNRGEGGESEIVRAQQVREKLHDDWTARPKGFDENKKRRYRKALATVTKHRHLANSVRLSDHVQLYYLLMQILGRMVDFAGLWERDLYFTVLGLMIEKNVQPGSIFKQEGIEFLKEGRIVEALREIIDEDTGREIKREIEQLFDVDFTSGGGNIRIRNNFMHFNMLRSWRESGVNTEANLTALVNDCRSLMGYDRKLKNAVSKSVKDLCAREKLDLRWEADNNHCLTHATVRTKQALHLKTKYIRENLCGTTYIKMATDLFDGTALPSGDVTSQDFDKLKQGGMQKKRRKKE